MFRVIHVAEEVAVSEMEAVDVPAVLGGSGWCWIDAEGVADDEIVTLGELLGFDPVAIADVLSPVELPKVADLGDHVFVVTHSAGLSEDRLATVELDAFITPAVLVTVRNGKIPAVEWTIDRLLRSPGGALAGPREAMVEILELSAQRYLTLIGALDGEIDQVEALAVAGHPEVVGRAYDLRRDAITLRRVLAPERDMVRNLVRLVAVDSLPSGRRLEGVYDDFFRIVESLDAARALLSAVTETYRSTVAERTNEVMKVLTVFSAIVLPLSLFAGIYGMNFAHMPELGWRWGYFALLGVMAVSGLGLWIYFARRGFIGGPRIPRVDRVIGRGLAGFVHLTTQPVRAVIRRPPSLPGSREGGEG